MPCHRRARLEPQRWRRRRRGRGSRGPEEEEGRRRGGRGGRRRRRAASSRRARWTRRKRRKDPSSRRSRRPRRTSGGRPKRKKRSAAKEAKLAKEEEGRQERNDASGRRKKTRRRGARRRRHEEEEEEHKGSKKRAKRKKKTKRSDTRRSVEGQRRRRPKTKGRRQPTRRVSRTAPSDDRGRYLSPAGRAVDAVVGMSFTAARSSSSIKPIREAAPGYKQKHSGRRRDDRHHVLSDVVRQEHKGIIRGIGMSLLYEGCSSSTRRSGTPTRRASKRSRTSGTRESRWAIGPVFRYPMGKIVVGGSLTYGKQAFTIAQKMPNNHLTDIPSVRYRMISRQHS